MTIYVAVDAVQAELKKLAERIKDRYLAGDGSIRFAEINLELAISECAIVSKADPGVLSREKSMAILDQAFAEAKTP